MSVANSGQVAHYITFRLGEELFAINVTQVREVLDMSDITKVPTAPAYMRGVVNVRGNAVPVVDLRLKFGLPSVPDTVNSRIVVLELELDGELIIMGGIADGVHDVIELATEQIQAPPRIGNRWQNDLIHGMGKQGDQFIILLDIAKVFSAEEALLAQSIAPSAISLD